MGGFFSSPSPPPAPPPVETVDPEIEARQQRQDAIARNRRGRAGMIATSDRGVLEPVSVNTATAAGKSLLGE